jgi:hypothetical protein
MGLRQMLHGHMVRKVWGRRWILGIVVLLSLPVRQDCLDVVVLEFVVVILKLVLVRLHFTFVVLQ